MCLFFFSFLLPVYACTCIRMYVRAHIQGICMHVYILVSVMLFLTNMALLSFITASPSFVCKLLSIRRSIRRSVRRSIRRYIRRFSLLSPRPQVLSVSSHTYLISSSISPHTQLVSYIPMRAYIPNLFVTITTYTAGVIHTYASIHT